MGTDQRGVEVDHERPETAHRTQAGRPGRCPGLAPSRSMRRVAGLDRLDGPAGRWCRGHRAEESGLIGQHPQVAEAVAAVGQGDGQIEQHLARIMTPRRRFVDARASLECPGQPQLFGHFGQQASTGMGGDTFAVGGH